MNDYMEQKVDCLNNLTACQHLSNGFSTNTYDPKDTTYEKTPTLTHTILDSTLRRWSIQPGIRKSGCLRDAT